MYGGAVLKIGPKMEAEIRAKNSRKAKRLALELLSNYYAYEVVAEYAGEKSKIRRSDLAHYRDQAAHILIGLTKYEKENGYVPGEVE